MLSRRTTLLALVCSVLASACTKNDLVEDTQSVREKLIETVGGDTEVYSVMLVSSDKPGAGVTQAVVRFKEGDSVKLQSFMLWGPAGGPGARDDRALPDDPEDPVRVADLDFSDVAKNVEASKALLPEDVHFMSVSTYSLPVGTPATWELSAGVTASASTRQTTVEYSRFKFGVSPSGDVVALPD